MIRGLLFDLDGTLLDTAQDLVLAVNRTLAHAGLPERSSAELTPLISRGAGAMLRRGLGDSNVHFEPLLENMLARYQDHVAVHSRLFEGMEQVLDNLDRAAIPWGIVTNKLARFADPLLSALGLDRRAGCVVCGDTTGERKPHPLPLIEAAKRLARAPSECLYVGDARTDIEAGRRAGMRTLAAVYGYLADEDDPGEWLADGLITRPLDLVAWLHGTQDTGRSP